jgi:hypothetical protein
LDGGPDETASLPVIVILRFSMPGFIPMPGIERMMPSL